MSKSTIEQRLATKAKVQCLLTEYLDLGRWQFLVMWAVGRSERQATTKWREEALDLTAALRAAGFEDVCLVERDPSTEVLTKLDPETGVRLDTA